jgi:multiple sugar transport system substrate-binding protein
VHSFAIPRQAANREAAAALVRHLTSFDAQLGEARLGSIPCRASALERVRAEQAADPIAATRWAWLDESQKTMIMPPRFAAYPACEDAIWRAVQRAMTGAISAAAALAGAAADVRHILRDA